MKEIVENYCPLGYCGTAVGYCGSVAVAVAAQFIDLNRDANWFLAAK